MDRKPTEQEIDEAIERILQRREFGGSGEQQERQVEHAAPAQPAPSRTPAPYTSSGDGTAVPKLVLVVLGILLLAFALSAVTRAERGRRLGTVTEQRRRERDDRLPDPLQAALSHAQRENYAEALVCLFALHLQQQEREGRVVLDESKTTLQYEFELMQSGYEDLASFRSFRKVFNGVRYGGYGVEQETWEHWLAWCRAHLQGRRAA